MRAKALLGIEQAGRVNGRKDHGVRRNAAQWARVIEAQRQSALTVVEFCRRRGIAKSTFGYWSKRLVTTKRHAPAVTLVPEFLAVPIVASGAARIEVDLGTMRMRLEGGAAARVVDALVARVASGAA